MNAHSPRRPIAAGELTAQACPAESIARDIATLQRRIAENDQAVPKANAVRGAQDLLERQLMDRIDVLQHQLEWVQPHSLAGVYAQLLQLQDLAHQAALEVADADEREDLVRRFDRLNALALDGLERLAGVDGDKLGKRDQLYPAPLLGLTQVA
jgi:hypothetical protein